MTDRLTKMYANGIAHIIRNNEKLDFQPLITEFLKEKNVERILDLEGVDAGKLNLMVQSFVNKSKTVILVEHKQQTAEENKALFEMMQRSGKLD